MRRIHIERTSVPQQAVQPSHITMGKRKPAQWEYIGSVHGKIHAAGRLPVWEVTGKCIHHVCTFIGIDRASRDAFMIAVATPSHRNKRGRSWYVGRPSASVHGA